MSRIPVRARLTIFFTLILALILVAVGLSVASIARNRIQSDMDDRLFRTAADVTTVIEQNFNVQSAFGPATLEQAVPDLGAFTSRGLLVQVLDADGAVLRASEAAPTTPLGDPPPASGDAKPAVGIAKTSAWTARVVNLPLVLSTRDGDQIPIGAVIVGERTDTLEETMRVLEQTLLLAAVAGLVLAAVGGYWIARRALRPVDAVTAAAAAIAADPEMRSSLDRRLDVPPARDELQRLSATFNAMLDHVSAAFSTQRQFLADASHELRTPLTAIRGNSDVLRRQADALPDALPGIVPVREAAADIQRESERMGRLLEDLLLLARADSTAGGASITQRTAHVRLDDVAAEVIRTTQVMADGQDLRLDAEAVTVSGDRDRLTQLLLVLMDNAVTHTPATGQITITVRCETDQVAMISVTDTGSGIGEADQARVFDRFYRVDTSRGRRTGGSGLGLSIAKAIAEAHGGSISVASAVGVGSTFTVRLPGCSVVEATAGDASSS